VNELPALAWAALCAVVVFIVIMNLALVALLRNKSSLKITARPSRSAKSWQNMGNMISVLRDPFARERQQLNELSERLHDLEKKKPDE